MDGQLKFLVNTIREKTNNHRRKTKVYQKNVRKISGLSEWEWCDRVEINEKCEKKNFEQHSEQFNINNIDYAHAKTLFQQRLAKNHKIIVPFLNSNTIFILFFFFSVCG